MKEGDKHAESMINRYRLRPEFQLFDLNNDRWEMNNLAEQPEQQAKLNELKAKITAWMKQQGDDGHLTGKGIKYAETEFAD